MMSDLTEKDVANYLAQNPDFFLNHESLLYKLKLSENRNGTVSLVEKQLSVMRERQKKTRRKLKEVIEAAEKNNEIFNNSRRLILDLMTADDSEAFFSLLGKSLKRDFNCKAYSLIIFGKPSQINHFTSMVKKETASSHVGALMRAKRPILGILRPEEQNFLFGLSNKKVMSCAVLSLKQHKKHIALLAIGSSDTNYFSSSMDTLFIEFIGDAIAKLLPKYLPKLK